jgi:predicted heme/steroid binding protein
MMSVFGLEKATVLKVVLVAVAALLAALLLVVARPALAASFSFAAAQHYAVGELPQDPIAADFDGKNGPDLATVNFNSFDVGVLLNNGDGTFAAAVSTGVSSGPRPGAAADFDNDGKIDLAIGQENANNVAILPGNGDGTFGQRVVFPAGSAPARVRSADFNGDARLDLAIANQDSNDISVLLNTSSGTTLSFASAQNYAVEDDPLDVAIADLDGNNSPDLVNVNASSNDVSVLLNNGDGTFAAAVNYAVGGLSLSIAPADFNGDGDADLAVANFFTDNVSVLLNNGDGTFPATPQNFAVGGVQPISIAPADFNGDGKIDLAVVGQGTNPKNTNVSALINTSTATAVDFEASQNVVTGTTPVGGVIGSVRSADFNGDTRPDLAVANGHIPDATDTVSVLLNNYGSDTTAPMLNLPGNITEEATEPTGATVSYTATATDDTDPNMPVDCSPVSGSTFTIGTTTVECTATDSSGNTASGSFTVTVKGATDQLSDIKELVASLPGLPAGTNTSLQAKLNDTLSAANGGDTASACTALKDFISQVRAQQGKKKISAQDAAKLISEAQRIQAVLGC